MGKQNHTLEGRVLASYPDLREWVIDLPEFAAWLRALTVLEVDGETFYLRGGDMLRDEDQVIFEWARKNGFLTDAAIREALTSIEEASNGGNE